MTNKRTKTLRAIRPNRGVELAYQKAIKSLIEEMSGSYEYWLKAAYRKRPPRMSALIEDAVSPSRFIARILDELIKRWMGRFNTRAKEIAKTYITHQYRHSDSAFRQALKESGWAIDFKMSQAMTDALNAQIADNIGLIKSIPQQYHQKVEGIVMRSYTVGADLETMIKELKALYPAASHRAVLIARDQSAKANSVVTQARQIELGIEEAIWIHSRGGKTPRPDHVAANGKKYKVKEGCLISGKKIQPGWMINCGCVAKSILPR